MDKSDKHIFLQDEYLKQGISNKYQYTATPLLELEKNWNQGYSLEILNRNPTMIKSKWFKRCYI